MTNFQHLNTDPAGTTRLIENIASELPRIKRAAKSRVNRMVAVLSDGAA